MLTILSRRYPFFTAPDDLASLAEIMKLFGLERLTIGYVCLFYTHLLYLPLYNYFPLSRHLLVHSFLIPFAFSQSLFALPLTPFFLYHSDREAVLCGSRQPFPSRRSSSSSSSSTTHSSSAFPSPSPYLNLPSVPPTGDKYSSTSATTTSTLVPPVVETPVYDALPLDVFDSFNPTTYITSSPNPPSNSTNTTNLDASNSYSGSSASSNRKCTAGKSNTSSRSHNSSHRHSNNMNDTRDVPQSSSQSHSHDMTQRKGEGLRRRLHSIATRAFATDGIKHSPLMDTHVPIVNTKRTSKRKGGNTSTTSQSQSSLISQTINTTNLPSSLSSPSVPTSSTSLQLQSPTMSTLLHPHSPLFTTTPSSMPTRSRLAGT